jgi:hypothetical protein
MSLFGFVIPGRMVATDFVQVSPNKFCADVPAPSLVPDLTGLNNAPCGYYKYK